MADNDPWYSPTHQQRDGIPRQRNAGREVWRLRHPDGRIQSCELFCAARHLTECNCLEQRLVRFEHRKGVQTMSVQFA